MASVVVEAPTRKTRTPGIIIDPGGGGGGGSGPGGGTLIGDYRVTGTPSWANQWGIGFADVQGNTVAGPVFGNIGETLFLDFLVNQRGHWILGIFEVAENLQRHVDCPPADVAGATVREVLDAVFDGNARARGYVLDDQGVLRHHMVVFVDGEMIADRAGLSDPVPEGGEVHVMQALSGG